MNESRKSQSGVRPLHIIAAIAIGAAVSLLALLPPGIHFVTGIFGPIIGGFVAGAVLRLRTSEAVILGIVLALGIGLPAPFLLRMLHILPRLETAAFIFFGIFGALYIGVFSMTGAYLGALASQRRRVA
ncbi:hypothetical protein [Thermorudis peleae]|uniref:hypothetical protein n=1 Tax=Thermorudis peleae TaxID=1382356 RepID=UPI000571FD54|nr:hypothetical protein [Thermorudis peleae]